MQKEVCLWLREFLEKINRGENLTEGILRTVLNSAFSGKDLSTRAGREVELFFRSYIIEKLIISDS